MDYNDDGIVDPLLADDEADEEIAVDGEAVAEDEDAEKTPSVWDIGSDGEIEEAV